MSIRQQQVESTLKRAISQVLARQLHDPRIEGLVSVTRVQVSPDFRDAYVYVSVLPDKFQKKTLAGLRHAASYIHGLVCKAVALRTVPHLDFRADESLKKEAAVFDAIRRGMTQEERAAAERDAQGPPAEGEAAADESAPASETEAQPPDAEPPPARREDDPQ